MAQEISLNIQLRCVNGNYDSGQVGASQQITQSAAGSAEGILTVPTTGVPLTTGSVTTVGILYLRNLHGSFSVEWGSTNYELQMLAGEQAVARIKPGVTISLKATGGTATVYQRLLQA